MPDKQETWCRFCPERKYCEDKKDRPACTDYSPEMQSLMEDVNTLIDAAWVVIRQEGELQHVPRWKQSAFVKLRDSLIHLTGLTPVKRDETMWVDKMQDRTAIFKEV